MVAVVIVVTVFVMVAVLVPIAPGVPIAVVVPIAILVPITVCAHVITTAAITAAAVTAAVVAARPVAAGPVATGAVARVLIAHVPIHAIAPVLAARSALTLQAAFARLTTAAKADRQMHRQLVESARAVHCFTRQVEHVTGSSRRSLALELGHLGGAVRGAFRELGGESL